MMIPHTVTKILTGNLQALYRVQAAIGIYLTLAPFARLSQQHANILTELKDATLPTHLRTLSTLISKYRVQPPLNTFSVQTPILGALAHLPFP
jgi:demethoxyubiquinone hydroxylase (CLK1/Coq7/Cat5 family)